MPKVKTYAVNEPPYNDYDEWEGKTNPNEYVDDYDYNYSDEEEMCVHGKSEFACDAECKRCGCECSDHVYGKCESCYVCDKFYETSTLHEMKESMNVISKVLDDSDRGSD